MNNKESELRKIVDIVYDCCKTEVDDKGTMSFTKEELLGKSRIENVVMTRAILCRVIVWEGYSVTTVAQLLGRTTQAIRHLIELGNSFKDSSRAYRIAEAESLLKVKDALSDK